MPKKETVAAIAFFSDDGTNLQLSTRGTKAAAGSYIKRWRIEYRHEYTTIVDGGVNSPPTLISKVIHTGGSWNIVFSVEDSKGKIAQTSLTMLIVRPDQPVPPSTLEIVTPSLPGGTVGVFYSQTLQGTGGTLPYTWSVFSGSLPTGLTLTGDVIQGTPTANGTFNFQIKLRDNPGTEVFRNFQIVVSVQALIITSSSPLPDAAQNEPYSVVFTASGGAPPYTWTRISGSFPSGLTLSGATLSGTPPTLGTSNFTMRVTDSLSNTADKAFVLEVAFEGPNDFFTQQVARPEHILSYSLRSTASINSMFQQGDNHFFYVFGTGDEDYADPQDGAKLIMSHTLATAEQLRAQLNSFNIFEGSIMVICDFWFGPEFRTNLDTLEHKFLNFFDGDQADSGHNIYCEPRTFYRPLEDPDPIIASLDLRSYSFLGPQEANPRFPAGLFRDTPYQPTGQGAVALRGYDVHHSKWCRFWILVDLHVTDFSEWAAAYNSGNPPAQEPIVSTTPGNPTIITHDGSRDYTIFDAINAGTRITIAGNSNASINGTWQATVVSATQLSIPVSTASAGSGGTITQHFHRVSYYVADEDRDPVRVYYKVPFAVRGNGKMTGFAYELNTSNHVTDGNHGAFITSSPTIGNPTTIVTSTPHDFVTGEWARIHGNNVIPNKTLGRVTVVNANTLQFPYNVTSLSSPDTSGEFVGTHGYVVKQLIGYARNLIFLRNFTANEADTTWLRKPVG